MGHTSRPARASGDRPVQRRDAKDTKERREERSGMGDFSASAREPGSAAPVARCAAKRLTGCCGKYPGNALRAYRRATRGFDSARSLMRREAAHRVLAASTRGTRCARTAGLRMGSAAPVARCAAKRLTGCLRQVPGERAARVPPGYDLSVGHRDAEKCHHDGLFAFSAPSASPRLTGSTVRLTSGRWRRRRCCGRRRSCRRNWTNCWAAAALAARAAPRARRGSAGRCW